MWSRAAQPSMLTQSLQHPHHNEPTMSSPRRTISWIVSTKKTNMRRENYKKHLGFFIGSVCRICSLGALDCIRVRQFSILWNSDKCMMYARDRVDMCSFINLITEQVVWSLNCSKIHEKDLTKNRWNNICWPLW